MKSDKQIIEMLKMDNDKLLHQLEYYREKWLYLDKTSTRSVLICIIVGFILGLSFGQLIIP